MSRRGEVRRRCRRTDAGTTLVELMVVMALMGGLMAIVISVLIGTMQEARDNSARAAEVAQVRLGLTQIDRHVRSGNVISDPLSETTAGSGVAAGYSLRVYTQTDGVFQCVQWRVLFPTVAGTPQNVGRLEFRSWSPAWRTTGGVEPWRTVARDVVRPAATAAAPFQAVANAASSAQSVRVTLAVGSSASEGRPLGVSSVLTGRNTVFGYPADECSDIPTP